MTELDLKLIITADNKAALVAINNTKKSVEGFGGTAQASSKKVNNVNESLRKTFSPSNRVSVKKTSDGIEKVGNNAKAASAKVGVLGQATKSAGGLARKLFAGYIGLAAVKSIITTADNMQQLEARVRLATKATGDFASTYSTLEKQALKTGASFEASIDLFQSLARTAPELKATTSEILQLTENVQKLAAVSGAGPEAMKNSMRQFSQGMAGGILRAEEFNSIIENTPAIAAAIAKGMNKTTGQLRLAVVAGTVLSKDVFKALLSQTDDINSNFEEMPLSLGRVGNSLKLSFANFIDEANDASDGVSSITEGIQSLAEYIYNLDGAAFADPFINIDLVFSSLTATVHKLSVTFGSVFSIIKETVIGYFKIMVNGAMSSLADLAGGASMLASSIGLDSLAASLGGFESELRPTNDASEDLKKNLDAIVLADKAAKEAIDNKVVSMIIERREANDKNKALKAEVSLNEAIAKSNSIANKKAEEASQKSLNQAKKEAIRITQAMLSPQETFAQKQKVIIDLRDKELISLETYNHALDKYTAALAKATAVPPPKPFKFEDTGLKDALSGAEDAINDFTQQEFLIDLNINGEAIGADLDKLFNGLDKISGIGSGFDRIAKARNTIADSIKKEQQNMVKLGLANQDYSKQKDKISAGRKADAELVNQSQKLEMQGYADIFSAGANMFSGLAAAAEEGSQKQKAFQMTAIITQTAVNVAMGIAAILQQAQGDPYTAIPRMIAMAGMVASMGVQIAGIAGGNKKSAAEKGQEAQVSGSIKGDTSLASNSIATAIDNLVDISEESLAVSGKMLVTLQATQQNILTTATQQITSDSIAKTFGKASAKLKLEMDLVQQREKRGVYATAVALAPFTMGLSVVFAPLIDMFRDIGGFGSHSSMIDSGVSFNPNQTVGQSIGGDLSASSFATSMKWQSVMFIKVDKKIEDSFGELDTSLTDNFSSIFLSISDSIAIGSGILVGSASEQIIQAMMNTPLGLSKVSLHGLSDDDAGEVLSQTFSKWADNLVSELFPVMNAFQQEGEGLYETFIRLSSSVDIAQSSLSQLGIDAISYTDVLDKLGDVSEQIVRQSIISASEFDNLSTIMSTASGTASELVDLYKDLNVSQRESINAGLGDHFISGAAIGASGGLSELQSNLEAFNDFVLTDAEKLANAQSNFADDFSGLDIALPLPSDADSFKFVANAIDTTSEAGQALLARFIALTPAFSELIELTDSFKETVIDSSELINAEKLKAGESLASLMKNINLSLSQSTMSEYEKSLNALDIRYSDLSISAAQLTREMDALNQIGFAKTLQVKKIEAAQSFKILSKSISDQKKFLSDKLKEDQAALNESLNLRQDANQELIDSAQDMLTSIQNIASQIKAAIGSTVVESYALNKARRDAAKETLKSALTHSNSGGSLVGFGGLEGALSDIQKPSEDLFATFQDYSRDQAIAANTLGDLSKNADSQVSVAEMSLEALNGANELAALSNKNQLDALQAIYDADIETLDNTLDSMSSQLDALNDINLSVMNVFNAVNLMTNALAGFASAKTQAANAATSTATYNPSTNLVTNSSAAFSASPQEIQEWVAAQSDNHTIYNAAIDNGISAKMLDTIMDWGVGTSNNWAVENNLPTFAKGGVTNEPSIFGEAGWEAAVPLPDGRSIPVTISGGGDNAELISEIRKLREEARAANIAIAKNTQDTAKLIKRWEGDGMPDTRSVTA